MSTVPVIFEGKPFTLATILNKHTKCLDLSLLEEKYAVVIHYNCWLLSNAGKKKWRSWILLHVSPSAAFSKYNTLECDVNMKNNGLVKLDMLLCHCSLSKRDILLLLYLRLGIDEELVALLGKYSPVSAWHDSWPMCICFPHYPF